MRTRIPLSKTATASHFTHSGAEQFAANLDTLDWGVIQEELRDNRLENSYWYCGIGEKTNITGEIQFSNLSQVFDLDSEKIFSELARLVELRKVEAQNSFLFISDYSYLPIAFLDKTESVVLFGLLKRLVNYDGFNYSIKSQVFNTQVLASISGFFMKKKSVRQVCKDFLIKIPQSLQAKCSKNPVLFKDLAFGFSGLNSSIKDENSIYTLEIAVGEPLSQFAKVNPVYKWYSAEPITIVDNS
jgi:hypothetical protein